MKYSVREINQTDDFAMAMAVYLLGFHTYMGFENQVFQNKEGDHGSMLAKLYAYAGGVKKHEINHNGYSKFFHSGRGRTQHDTTRDADASLCGMFWLLGKDAGTMCDS